MSSRSPVVPRGKGNVRFAATGTGRYWWPAAAVIALAGAGLVLLSTAKYGAGFSDDSIWYLDVARSLMQGRGFTYFRTGQPLSIQPPLYPALLALIGSATRLDPAAFAHLVNAALFALVILLSARLFRTAARLSAAHGMLGVCAVLLSISLTDVYAMAWSECLFIPLLLLHLVFAQRHRDSGGVPALAGMTLATALACLTRYLGVALVPAGVATILFASGVNRRNRLSHALAFAILSAAPLGLWLLRNRQLTGAFFGSRVSSMFSLAENLVFIGQSMLAWYVPGPGRSIVLAGIAVAAIVAFAAIAVVWSRASRSRALESLKATLTDHFAAAMVVLATILMILVTATTTSVGVGPRLLSPLYVPVTLVLFELAVRRSGPASPSPNAKPGRGLAVLMSLWLCFPLAGTSLHTARRFRDGAGGYSTRRWRESETIACARRLLAAEPGARVYSNVRAALWAMTGASAAKAPAKTEQEDTSRVICRLGDLVGRWPPANGAYLVWFEPGRHADLFSVEELSHVADIVEVAHLSDGSIYRVSARPTGVRNSSQSNGPPPSQAPSEGRPEY